MDAGAHSQRLLWASTGTKDPNASDILYVEGLALPFTINTMPEVTLKALADHEEFAEALPEHSQTRVLSQFAKAGIDTDAVASPASSEEGVASFAKSWNDLIECIGSKSQATQGRVSTRSDHALFAAPLTIREWQPERQNSCVRN